MRRRRVREQMTRLQRVRPMRRATRRHRIIARQKGIINLQFKLVQPQLLTFIYCCVLKHLKFERSANSRIESRAKQ